MGADEVAKVQTIRPNWLPRFSLMTLIWFCLLASSLVLYTLTCYDLRASREENAGLKERLEGLASPSGNQALVVGSQGVNGAMSWRIYAPPGRKLSLKCSSCNVDGENFPQAVIDHAVDGALVLNMVPVAEGYAFSDERGNYWQLSWSAAEYQGEEPGFGERFTGMQFLAPGEKKTLLRVRWQPRTPNSVAPGRSDPQGVILWVE